MCETAVPLSVARHLVAVIQDACRTTPVDDLVLAYEAALPQRRNVAQSQRLYLQSCVRHLDDQLSRLGLRFRFEALDNRLVKITWHRTFGTERALLLKEERLYAEVQAYIKGMTNRPTNTSTDRTLVQQAHKFANYVVWCARGLPDLLDPDALPGTATPTAFRLTHRHPVSDLVDAYALARHSYWQNSYRALRERTEEEPETDETYEHDEKAEHDEKTEHDETKDASENERTHTDRFRPGIATLHLPSVGFVEYYVVELTEASWQERKHYKDEVVVQDYDTGVFICQQEGTDQGIGPGTEPGTEPDDRHATAQELRDDPRRADLDDPEDFFIFVWRTHTTKAANLNRVRRELRKWSHSRYADPIE